MDRTRPCDATASNEGACRCRIPPGGSDFVMLSEEACGLELDAESDRHRMQGERVGVCRR